jgi:hypothetical protein
MGVQSRLLGPPFLPVPDVRSRGKNRPRCGGLVPSRYKPRRCSHPNGEARVGEVPDQRGSRMGRGAIKSSKVATTTTGAEKDGKGTCLE